MEHKARFQPALLDHLVLPGQDQISLAYTLEVEAWADLEVVPVLALVGVHAALAVDYSSEAEATDHPALAVDLVHPSEEEAIVQPGLAEEFLLQHPTQTMGEGFVLWHSALAEKLALVRSLFVKSFALPNLLGRPVPVLVATFALVHSYQVEFPLLLPVLGPSALVRKFAATHLPQVKSSLVFALLLVRSLQIVVTFPDHLVQVEVPDLVQQVVAAAQNLPLLLVEVGGLRREVGVLLDHL